MLQQPVDHPLLLQPKYHYQFSIIDIKLRICYYNDYRKKNTLEECVLSNRVKLFFFLMVLSFFLGIQNNRSRLLHRYFFLIFFSFFLGVRNHRLHFRLCYFFLIFFSFCLYHWKTDPSFYFHFFCLFHLPYHLFFSFCLPFYPSYSLTAVSVLLFLLLGFRKGGFCAPRYENVQNISKDYPT
jgi:hypothetical protein